MTRHFTAPHNIETKAAIHRRRLLRTAITLACAVLYVASMTMLLSSTDAQAANWMEVSCENPNLSAAPSEGWTSFAAGGGYGSNNSTGCGPGSPMFAILSTQAAVGVGSAETLQYTPPGGSTLIGGSVDVSMYADGGGYNASGTAVAYTPNYAYDGSDVFFQCASGLPPCANGTYDFAGVLGIPGGRGGNFYLSAGCGGASGYACNSGGSEGAWSLVRLWWANFLLSNVATPAASGVGGTVLSANARGTQELTFTASDPGGPGVYVVTAQVDGKTLYSGTPDNNGGKCVPVGSSGGALMFDYSQPCRASESVDLSINTASVADGQHTLKVTVQDAAQNSSVVYDGAITTKNAPANTTAPTVLTPSQVFVGAALSTHPGAWSVPTGAGAIAYGYQWEDCDAQGNNCQPIAGAQSASYTPAPSDIGHTLRVLVNASDSDGLASAASATTSTVLSAQGSLGAGNGPGTGPGSGTGNSQGSGLFGTGAPNGTTASETAVLRLGVRRTISRSFAKRALKLKGRLLNSQGHPIGAATLDVLQQVAGRSEMQVIAHAHTSSNGSFLATVPAGPSRLVEVAYRAFSGDTTYTVQDSIRESVSAGVKLYLSPPITSPHGVIVITGQVMGPIPPQGVIVHVQIFYHHLWVPLRTPQTDSSGYFHFLYQFQGASGSFPVVADIPVGQAGFPYNHGKSKEAHVVAR